MTSYLWDNLFRRSDQDQDVLDTLAQTYIFNSLTRKELGFVQETVHVRDFKPGERIFQHGGVGMYAVLTGALEILVDYLGDLTSGEVSHADSQRA